MKKNNKSEWIDNNGNFILIKKGYYISYNPNTNANPLGLNLNVFGGLMGSIIGKEIESDGRAETALCKDGNYFILNGDFRKDYEKCKSYAECLKFFKSKEKFKSGWSN